MKHRSLKFVFPALVIALVFSGCESKTSASKFDGNSWTSRTLAESMTLCGQNLTYPLTVESLGEDFSISEAESNGTGSTANLLYNGDDVGVLRFECAPDMVTGATAASRFIFIPDDDQLELLSVNGFTAKDSLETAKKKIGEPTEEKGMTLYYKTSDNGKLEIIEGTGQKIYAINLYFDTGNNV